MELLKIRYYNLLKLYYKLLKNIPISLNAIILKVNSL